ncbi:hypothetical protein PPYR_10619 [Photinus pyralis]|uniref:L-seryl-tRNA(Sec) kinase n=1 Tax=Photinus pyralis TaxID=7054 RepID=A0A1Y1NLV0_PHOPY|nr:L-seryl-tRNA(Sec) kinase [Photinus pyralis]KAB0796558.1 hypothetical protein PPYR_10619 [Photinus pyralis]
MSKICIVLLIGIPGAGKTTFHTTLRRSTDDVIYKFHTVVYDELVVNDCEISYKCKRGKVFAIATELMASILTLPTNHKHVIIIDDNMYLKSMRYEYYKHAERLELSFLEVYFEVNIPTALLRNSTRENKVPEKTILKMAQQIEKPIESWEGNVFRINSNLNFDDNLYLEFFNKLELSFCKTLRRKVDCHTEKMSITKLQAVDLVLRKIAHGKIKEDKDNASKVCAQKKHIFNAVRQGTILVEDGWDESELFTNLMLHFR